MNKFNNPRLTNTTVSGTGVKHPMRPHVILGDPENGFIRGDLLDANAVIKLIKNAAKAIGALEELEQSNWIDDNDTTEEPVGVLQEGEVGFSDDDDVRVVYTMANSSFQAVGYTSGANTAYLNIADNKAFGMSLKGALRDGYIEVGDTMPQGYPFVNYADVKSKELKYATR